MFESALEEVGKELSGTGGGFKCPTRCPRVQRVKKARHMFDNFEFCLVLWLLPWNFLLPMLIRFGTFWIALRPSEVSASFGNLLGSSWDLLGSSLDNFSSIGFFLSSSSCKVALDAGSQICAKVLMLFAACLVSDAGVSYAIKNRAICGHGCTMHEQTQNKSFETKRKEVYHHVVQTQTGRNTLECVCVQCEHQVITEIFIVAPYGNR